MHAIDSIKENTRTTFSFEVLPPLKGTGIDSLFRTIDELREFDPKYINITTHRSEYVYQESPEGVFHKVSLRRRPGTVAVAAAIKNRYDITGMTDHYAVDKFEEIFIPMGWQVRG